MRVLAPAKINLHLRVGPPRADGFHPLLSWMCTAGLYDEIQIEPAVGDCRVELQCDDPSIPLGAENLVVRAALALGVCANIQLLKRIPAGGGLAGGSSDAARTLMGLNRLMNLRKPPEELAKLAARLGSDVSFFLHGPSSVCAGVGETVTPIPAPAARWALLVFPPFAMATPRVYRRFDELKLGDVQRLESPPPWEAWAGLPAGRLLPELINDLESPAFDLNPALAGLRAELERHFARPVRMSGSGSTLFTLFDTRDEARAAAESCSQKVCVVELAPKIADDLAGYS